MKTKVSDSLFVETNFSANMNVILSLVLELARRITYEQTKPLAHKIELTNSCLPMMTELHKVDDTTAPTTESALEGMNTNSKKISDSTRITL